MKSFKSLLVSIVGKHMVFKENVRWVMDDIGVYIEDWSLWIGILLETTLS